MNWKNDAHASLFATSFLKIILNIKHYKLNNTVNSFLHSPKVESNDVAFFFKLGFL